MPESHGTPYPELSGLDGYYFEDSFVLAIRLAPDAISFDLVAVMTPAHPDYHAPLSDEQHAYQDARLVFPKLTRFTILTRGPVVPATDRSGKTDFGNIDSLVLLDGRYRIEGDWGTIEVESDPPEVVLRSSDIRDH